MIHTDPNNSNITQIYSCIICMLNTTNQKDYERHLLTAKHKNVENIMMNNDNFIPNTRLVFICDCGNPYKHNRSLCFIKKLEIINRPSV
jgi:hypothetical protein